MPYKNIVFTKLRCELATDERFTDKLDDEEKLLFFCLLLLAGVKENNIPDDEKWLKRTLNLSISEQKIREKLTKIFEMFPKTISRNGFIKFKNYNKMHNPLGNPTETPKNIPENNPRIKKIIEEYIKNKRYITTNEDGSKNQEIINALFKRNCRVAKRMLSLAKGNTEKIIECMCWFGDICDKKGLSWTLETIEKWLPEYLAKGESISQEQVRKEFGLK